MLTFGFSSSVQINPLGFPHFCIDFRLWFVVCFIFRLLLRFLLYLRVQGSMCSVFDLVAFYFHIFVTAGPLLICFFLLWPVFSSLGCYSHTVCLSFLSFFFFFFFFFSIIFIFLLEVLSYFYLFAAFTVEFWKKSCLYLGIAKLKNSKTADLSAREFSPCARYSPPSLKYSLHIPLVKWYPFVLLHEL